MNQTFDWSLVQSFLAALDQGSLLGAARALNASQPTIGRHIAELESQLGVVLFERTGRGLLPTATALRLAESARAMEMGAHQLARSVSGAEEGVTGTVRIHATSPNAALALAQVQAAVAALFAETDIGGVVYLSDIYQAIEGVEGVDSSTLTSPTGDTALAADAVPVLSGTLTSTLV